MDTFGEWLQQQRSLRRLTREEFAKRIGCSVSALRKIEYGERRPSAQLAELLANCLDVPLEERSTFVRVARDELRVDRLHPASKLVAIPNVSYPKTNLPIFPTPLIGRERELEQLSQLLCDPQCRLLTLVGPGGIGKTRLAVEAASNLLDAFPDGVYFIPLASANSTRFIVPVIADAIGFAFHPASHADPKTQLFSYLKQKRALLLTDNLEQLLTEPGIEVLVELLADAPQVKLLVTSREPLGLQDEWVFEVEGLLVPESIYAEGAAQNTSVELFLQRARRAHVGFNATPEDFRPIVRICQFAAEQFAGRPEEQNATQARHGRYYLTFFGQADGRLRSSAQREVLAELTAEIDNFRSAWDWAVTHGEFALIEQTMRLFAWFYDIRGWSRYAWPRCGRAGIGSRALTA